MRYAFSYQKKPRYLHIQVTGENNAENIQRYLSEVYEACVRERCSAVLIEENLVGPRLDAVVVYRIIAEGSSHTSPVILKIAYVDVQASQPAPNVQLAEVVAQDRGAPVRAFSTVTEAEAWLATQIT